MLRNTRKVTRVIARTITAASLASLAPLLVNGCSSGSEFTAVEVGPVGELGRLQLNLTGVSNTNQVYRLRNATFSITGRATGFFAAVDTERQPDPSSLLVELPPDTYDVLLEPGHFLELLPGGAAPSARRATAGRGGPAQPAKPSARTPMDPAPPASEPPPVSPGATRVEATLISSNPAVVGIQPNVVSPLSFVFQVGSSVVETGSGVLDIGIAIVDEAGACVADEHEPNDDPAAPAALTPGVPLVASLCDVDIDNYIFAAPVAEGEQFTVSVAFQHASGDIDAVLLEADSGFAVSFGIGITDNEVLFATSNGGSYILQTSLFADPDGGGNDYTVDVVAGFEITAENACCEESPGPGCNDDEVLACVCAQDSFCCQGGFDAVCISLALQCGATCSNDGAESDCCTASNVPGCTDDAVHDCMCATDFACCSSGFDDVCVAQAIGECGAQCTLPPPVSDCCSASSVPGCTVPDVQACICGIDPFCCTGSFDESCAALATEQCGAQCAF